MSKASAKVGTRLLKMGPFTISCAQLESAPVLVQFLTRILQHASYRDSRPLSSLCAVDKQCARFAESAQLSGVAEPPAGIGFRRRSRIGNAAMRDIREAHIAK